MRDQTGREECHGVGHLGSVAAPHLSLAQLAYHAPGADVDATLGEQPLHAPTRGRIDSHARRLHHAPDVDREHVVGQLEAVRPHSDPAVRVEGRQHALVGHRAGVARKHPHVDAPRAARQRTGSRGRRDAAVVEEARRQNVHPMAGGDQSRRVLEDVQVRVAGTDQEDVRHRDAVLSRSVLHIRRAGSCSPAKVASMKQ
ncbi:MAG: hypothetical protein ACQERF_09610 [Actinomycetota bacterium]